ncbi:MAG: PSD1 and planctomycete cytochrome C domain-containing protein [Verrucomicrobiota bacterium]
MNSRLQILALIFATTTIAADDAEFFESQVRPLLLDRCAKCHDGSASAESSLNVLSRKSLIDGSEFGPAILPGRAEESLLIHAVRRTHKELRMPPEELAPLTADQVAVLAKWIDDGAYWPDEETQIAAAYRENHGIAFDPEIDWAFTPRKVASPTKMDGLSNPIDRFLEAERRERGIAASPRADRQTLIRRLTFDLTGLPPAPEEVDAFVSDPAEDRDAFGNLVRQLLDSPRYGERQGRLWLDVARYADTQGDPGDYPINTAYLYRNWVINALNRDLPFDEFLRAQIAGDILAQQTDDKQKARDMTAATMFISLSRRFGNARKDSFHLTVEDTLDTVGRGVLGLTLRCARCHNHKFDPISQRDYYALYGIFESTIYPWMGMSTEKTPSDLSPAIPSAEGRQRVDDYWAKITRYEYQINNHFRPWLKPTLDEFKEVKKKLAEGGAEDEVATLGVRREELLGFRDGKFRELMLHGLQWLKDEKKQLGREPAVEMIYAVGDKEARDAKLHRRGNPENLGDVVPRGFVEAIHGLETEEISGSGRLQLANWLTNPNHPLTARVIVNRVWQQHFGRGLVSTADNFGRQGSLPSHPQLLDWLADRFVADGWSLKKLHRLILESEAYQLSSADQINSADPENVYLWKFSRRRLDSEAIRDSILFVSGQLDLEQPGAHEIPEWFDSRYGLNKPFREEIQTNHRSVYLLTQRIYRHSQLDLFDGPDRSSSVGQRTSSNTPAQALFLMNSDFVKTQATSLANRVDGIDELFLRLYGRKPSEGERVEIEAFLTNYEESGGDAWKGLCRTLLTSNEFFFID